MVEYEFLTPLQLWSGYSPVREPLEPSITKSYEQNGIEFTQFLLTAATADDGKLRVMIMTAKKAGSTKDHMPTALIIPTPAHSFDFEELATKLVAQDFFVAAMDLGGQFAEGEKHTTYPPSLSYAQYVKGKNLNALITGAKQTAWFVWTMMARRVLTYLEQSPMCDSSRIAVIGFEHGADVGWLCAGSDGRVKALAPINGCGYTWHRDYNKFDSAKLMEDDAICCLLTGIGVETYAKMVTCPVYYFCSSNNSYADVDRAGDTLEKVGNAEKTMSISPRQNHQITHQNLACLIKWLDATVKQNKHVEFEAPKLELFAESDELYAKLLTPPSSTKAEVYFSEGQPYSQMRDWVLLKGKLTASPGEKIYPLHIKSALSRIYAFATVTDSRGYIVSTPVVSEQVTALSRNVETADNSSHLVWNSTFPASLFSSDTSTIAVDALDTVVTMSGPHGIKGVTTTEGNLIKYGFADSGYAKQKGSLLQFDLYSENQRSITLCLKCPAPYRAYNWTGRVGGKNAWERIKLAASDFKDERGKPLQSFEPVGKAEFIDAEKVLLTNVLWL